MVKPADIYIWIGIVALPLLFLKALSVLWHRVRVLSPAEAEERMRKAAPAAPAPPAPAKGAPAANAPAAGAPSPAGNAAVNAPGAAVTEMPDAESKPAGKPVLNLMAAQERKRQQEAADRAWAAGGHACTTQCAWCREHLGPGQCFFDPVDGPDQ